MFVSNLTEILNYTMISEMGGGGYVLQGLIVKDLNLLKCLLRYGCTPLIQSPILYSAKEHVQKR